MTVPAYGAAVWRPVAKLRVRHSTRKRGGFGGGYSIKVVFYGKFNTEGR